MQQTGKVLGQDLSTWQKCCVQTIYEVENLKPLVSIPPTVVTYSSIFVGVSFNYMDDFGKAATEKIINI